MANQVTKALIKALNTYLLDAMPSLEKAYDDFPNQSQNLIYPCLTVFTQQPIYTPLMPYVKNKGVKDEESGKTPVNKVMGMYDFRFQVDIWCDSKPQRNTLYDEFFHAINSDIELNGLRLQVADYFNEWVQFDLDRLEFVDNEAVSQRAEWRARATLLVNCRAMKSGEAFVIETIENNLETPDLIPAPPVEDPELII